MLYKPALNYHHRTPSPTLIRYHWKQSYYENYSVHHLHSECVNISLNLKKQSLRVAKCKNQRIPPKGVKRSKKSILYNPCPGCQTHHQTLQIRCPRLHHRRHSRHAHWACFRPRQRRHLWLLVRISRPHQSCHHLHALFGLPSPTHPSILTFLRGPISKTFLRQCTSPTTLALSIPMKTLIQSLSRTWGK